MHPDVQDWSLLKKPERQYWRYASAASALAFPGTKIWPR